MTGRKTDPQTAAESAASLLLGDASAAAETRMGRSAARRSRDAAAFDSDYQEMLHNGRVTDTDGFLDNDR